MPPRPTLLATIALLLTLAACGTTSPTTEDFPTTRPTDFEVSFLEFGGPNDPRHSYKVTTNEAAYTDEAATPATAWTFKPTAQDLDNLYAELRDLKVHTLKSEVEQGEDKDRFGYALELKYNGKQHKVTDQGNEYIQLEADYNRFMDAIAVVREYVAQGISDQMVPFKASLLLDRKAPRPDSVSLWVEQRELLTGYEAMKPGDTLSTESTFLTGTYHVVAKANHGTQQWLWEQDMTHGKQGTDLKLVLGKKGFAIQ